MVDPARFFAERAFVTVRQVCLIVMTMGFASVGMAQNPSQAKEPETLEGITLVKSIKVPLRLIFHTETIDGKKVLFSGRAKSDLNVGGTAQDVVPRERIELGKRFPATDYELIGFTLKVGIDAKGTPVDCSDLDVKNLKTGETQHLIENEIANASEKYALLKTPQAEFEVKLGGAFSLTPTKEIIWCVTKISESEVLLKQEGSGKLARIRK